MDEKLIESYIPIVTAEVVEGYSHLITSMLGLEDYLQPEVKSALCDMGVREYIVNNVYNLVLDEDVFEDLIETSIKIHQMKNDLCNRVGVDKVNLLTLTTGEKMDMWYKNHEPELVEKISARLQEIIDSEKEEE